MRGISGETVFVAGYALLLLACAVVLDLLARHSHHRAARYRTAGFTFHEHLDAWTCPEGQHLWRYETDEIRRLARYRGKPQICNACRLKHRCTDSYQGREIARALDPWPHSEAGRFHRGIAVLLIALAGIFVAAEAVRHHSPMELAVLFFLLAVCAALGARYAEVFIATPTNAPELVRERP